MRRKRVCCFAVLLAVLGFARAAEGVRKPQPEGGRLAISFTIWALFDMVPGGTFADPDRTMSELKARGFNAIRFDDGAGLYATTNGVPRGPATVYPIFGAFSPQIRQSDVLATKRTVDVRTNLVKLCRAAQKAGVKVILSSWYYLHTFWITDAAINRELIDGLDTPAKLDYFADEHIRALALLREHGLIDTVAFVELLNEFDGLPFTANYGKIEDATKAEQIRGWHEKALAKMKRANPDVRFGYDVANVRVQENLVPRNADVLNFHHYYFWPIYQTLEHRSVRETVVETPIPPETAQYLRQPPLSIAEVVETRCGNLRVSNDWNARVRLYASLDDAKMPALEAAFDEVFARERETYVKNLKDGVARVVALRDRILPGVPIVFGEGVSYVAGMRFLYEEKSERYWRMLEEQSRIFRAAGLYGAVPRTNSGPEEPGWQTCAEKFRRVNDLFAGK